MEEKEFTFTNRFQLIPAAILIACTLLMGLTVVFCEKAFGNNSIRRKSRISGF